MLVFKSSTSQRLLVLINGLFKDIAPVHFSFLKKNYCQHVRKLINNSGVICDIQTKISILLFTSWYWYIELASTKTNLVKVTLLQKTFAIFRRKKLCFNVNQVRYFSVFRKYKKKFRYSVSNGARMINGGEKLVNGMKFLFLINFSPQKMLLP